MPEPDPPIVRFVGYAIIASLIAFVLLKLWMLTAPSPWSSEAWLERIPEVVQIAGCVAGVTLLLILFIRWMKRKKKF